MLFQPDGRRCHDDAAFPQTNFLWQSAGYLERGRHASLPFGYEPCWYAAGDRPHRSRTRWCSARTGKLPR